MWAGSWESVLHPLHPVTVLRHVSFGDKSPNAHFAATCLFFLILNCRAGLVLVLLAVGVNLIISTSQLGA